MDKMFPPPKTNRKSGTTSKSKEHQLKFRNSDELAKALIKSTEESESFLKRNVFDKNVEELLKIREVPQCEIPKSVKKVQFAKAGNNTRGGMISMPIREVPSVDSDLDSDLNENSKMVGVPVLNPVLLEEQYNGEVLNLDCQNTFRNLPKSKVPAKNKLDLLKGQKSPGSYVRKSNIGSTSKSTKDCPPDYSDSSEEETIIHSSAKDLLNKRKTKHFVEKLGQKFQSTIKDDISHSSEEEQIIYGSAEDFLNKRKSMDFAEKSWQKTGQKSGISHFELNDSDPYDHLPKKESININKVMGLSIKRNGELRYPKVLTAPPNISRYLMDENSEDIDLNLDQQKAKDVIEKLKAKFKITDNTSEHVPKNFGESDFSEKVKINSKVEQTDIRSDPKVKTLLDKLASCASAAKVAEVSSSIIETKEKENKIDELMKKISFYASESHKRVNEINAFISQSKENLERNMNDHITKREVLLQSMQERFSIKMQDIADTCRLLEEDGKNLQDKEDAK